MDCPLAEGLIKNLLAEGRLLSNLELFKSCAESFPALSPKDQVALILYGRKYPQLKEILKTHLNLGGDTPPKLVESLLNNPLIEVEIPTVNLTEGRGEVRKIYLITDTPITWSNLESLQTPLQTKLEPLANKKFAVLSETTFDGYSYLLPLAVALKEPNLLTRYCFSGNLESDGTLLPVDGIDKKEKACRSLGKTLITSEDFDTIRNLLKFLTTSPKPLPFLLATKGRTTSELKNNLNLLIKASGKEVFPTDNFYKRLFNKPPYWDYGKLNTKGDWQRVLKDFSEVLKKVDSTFEDTHLHLTLDGPSALAFGLGIIHGAHKKATFYQFQGGNYFPVIRLDEQNSRLLKSYSGQTDLVKVKDFWETDKAYALAVVLDFVSHPLSRRVEEFLKENQIKADTLILEHSQKANLDVNREWTEDVAQTFTLIRNFWEKKPYKEILFFFGTPVAFAFGLGCAVGHFYRGRVFNYSPVKNTYEEVYKIEKLEKVR